MRKVFGWGMGLVLLLSVITLPLWWNRPQAVFYSVYRDRGRESALQHLSGYQSLSGQHFVVRYSNADADVAEMVLQTAERSWQPVTDALGYAPTGLVPLIIYPDRDTLRHAFGWSAQESAMGVYWRGVIRVLSPHAWIDGDNPAETAKAFARLGPVPHEFTHYVLDYMTAGNYPRWFTEGLAQSVEYRMTRYQWVEQENRLDQVQTLYAFSDLNRHFDELSNQALAYRESFCLVEYLFSTGGPAHMQQLLLDLSQGISFETALHQVYGLTPDELGQNWLPWAHSQPYLMHPAA